MNYKLSLVTTLVYRAYRLCSTKPLLHKEIERITRNLVNNGFPQSIIDRQIQSTLKRLREPKPETPKSDSDNIVFYYRCLDVDSCKGDKSFLTDLFRKHIIPELSSKSVQIRVYYKPKKLSSSFSLRPRRSEMQRHGLVYQFSCQHDGCDASYIGYTMNSLATRARQHKYSSSKICCHFQTDHGTKPTDEILGQFEILYSGKSLRHNRLAEALLIKRHRPLINVRFNEMAGGLTVFK